MKHSKVMKNILLVEDDEVVLQLICKSLIKYGRPSCAKTHEQYEAALRRKAFDLVIVDYKKNSWRNMELIYFLRSIHQWMPIIVVSASADKDMAIRCANIRVHKIIEKPLSQAQLLTAVDELFDPSPTAQQSCTPYGPFMLHEAHFFVKIGPNKIQLTETEFKIFKLLVENLEQIVERDTFKKSIWEEMAVAPNVLDTHLLNLKRKIPALKDKIRNTRGRGYYLIAHD